MPLIEVFGELWLYASVKLPMYAYESVEDMKESMPYHRIRHHGRRAKLRRLFRLE